MSRKIGRGHQQLAGLFFCFCFKAFSFFFFYRSFFLFSIHIHRILWSCKDRCKWSGLCKPTHLIDADAINKSTRIPPLTFSFRSTPGIPHSCGSSPNSHPSCFLLKVLEQSEIAQHSTAADCVFFFVVFHRDSVKLKELVKNQMEKKENYHHKKIEAAVSISPINIYLLVIGGLAMV